MHVILSSCFALNGTTDDAISHTPCRTHLALILAPFFVHLELLFPLGFKPELRKEINNLAAIELTRVRKLEGEKKRAAEAKKAQ
jgi:hypothetical protein